MDRERYRKFFSDSLVIAKTHGTTLQQDDMAGMVSFGSMYLHHLEDQETGIEDPRKNPHHPKEALESGLFSVAIKTARLRRQILGKTA